MPYLKLDVTILDSTLWVDRAAREVFLTALLMATPRHIEQPTPQLCVRSLDETGWVVPPGDYGFIESSGPGIVRRALVPNDEGLEALERLGAPDQESRSQDFEGRRLVRVDGGYIALNYDRYRQKDHTNAARQKRYRERQKATGNGVTSLPVTQAEAEAEAEARRGGGRKAPPGHPRHLRFISDPYERGAVPNPRRDPEHEKFPFDEWSAGEALRAYGADNHMRDDDWQEVERHMRNSYRGKHDVEWWDVKAQRCVDIAIKRLKENASAKRGEADGERWKRLEREAREGAFTDLVQKRVESGQWTGRDVADWLKRAVERRETDDRTSPTA